MRKSLVFAVAALLALLAPAVAEAHHAEGTADCTAAYVNLIGFGSYDKSYGVDITVKIDGHQVATRHVSPNEFPGSDLTVKVPYSKPQDAKDHLVQVYISWRTSSGYFAKTIGNCTPPPPPPPSCGSSCSPPPPAPPVPPPTPPTPPVPPTPPPVPPKPPAKCMSAGRYSITVTPKHALHGLVHFRLNGPHVKKVRWFVDHKRRGTHAYPNRAPYERTSGKGGRIYHVFLWAKPVWGPALYGYHRIRVRVITTEGCTVTKRLRYKNEDPPRWGITTKGAPLS